MAPANSPHDQLDHSGQYVPGQGSRDPNKINNKGFFALFALLGVAIVITTIWFFFWAKNGGFVWRRGDWDDYKSTVLRRKGPDGKTLSNATPRTNLGQKSVAGTFDIERHAEMRETKQKRYTDMPRRERREKQSHAQSEHSGSNKTHFPRDAIDNDVREYRREKPARVGGLNRGHDGSHYDHTNTDRSDIMSHAHTASEISNNSRTHLRPSPHKQEPAKKKKKGFMEKQREKKQERQQKKEAKAKDNRRATHAAPAVPAAAARPARRYSFTTVATETVADSTNMRDSHQRDSSYYGDYRPAPPRHSSPRTSGAPRRTSYQPSSSRQAPTRSMPRAPGTFDAYSEAGSSDTGTKSYTHHIPGLSRGAPTVSAGFRRGGATTSGRRDSLSDSD